MFFLFGVIGWYFASIAGPAAQMFRLLSLLPLSDILDIKMAFGEVAIRFDFNGKEQAKLKLPPSTSIVVASGNEADPLYVVVFGSSISHAACFCPYASPRLNEVELK